MTIHTSLRGFWFALGATAVLAGSSLVAFQLLSGKILPLPQNRFHATDEPASGSRLANTLVATTLVPTDLEESSGQPNTQNSETQNSETQNNEDEAGDRHKAATEAGLRSPPEVIEPAVWIEQLSDSQLKLLARADELPAGFTPPQGLSRQRLHELLVLELVRRLENQTASEAKQATAVPGQVRQPISDSFEAPTLSETELASRNNPSASEVASSGPVGQFDAGNEAKPPEVIVERTRAVAVSGEPLGVGQMEVEFKAGHGPILSPDQLLFLRSSERRSHYATFEVDYQDADGQSKYQVQRIRSLFLVAGRGPIEFRLYSAQAELAREQLVEVVDDRDSQMRMRREWWQAFSRMSPELTQEQRELKVAMLDLLARRHRFSLSQQQRSVRVKEDRESLETQFENAVEMLFGIESVKIAMQGDVTLRDATRPESADLSVPKTPRMNSISVPDFKPVPIEAIAMRVPAECFYVRTGSVANYFYFREFLTGWGGSLEDIVSRGSFDRRIRERLEFQLAIDSATIDREQLDDSISDMAIIGCDSLFKDGAAIGVIFEASDGLALANQITNQRRQAMKDHPEVEEQRVRVRQQSVSLLATDDHRVRSFYAIDGRYHLITNSEHILKRFFAAGEGDRSLGQLREFGYARSKPKAAGEMLTFLYLSDPFFQNLVSPRYRIEMTRRAVATREAQQLQLARLIARAERVKAETVNDLIRASLLPKFFGARPDGSRATYRNHRYQDTLRGVPGSFLPVPDVPIDKATSTEVSSYRHFVSQYNRQWGRIDPVTVTLSKQADLQDEGIHKIGLEILVTPYAKMRYSLLNRHLAGPSQQQLVRSESDLLSVQAAVRSDRANEPHLLSIGLRDDAVAFEMDQGEVQLLGEAENATFAKSRGYLAITPPSLDVLRTLASVLLKGQARLIPVIGQLGPARKVPLILPPSTPIVCQVGYYLGWAVRNAPPGAIGAAKYLSLIESRDDLMVVSETEALREKMFANSEQERVDDPAKIRLRMRALQDASVEPYIQAYTYLDSRRASAQNSRLLNEWTDWFRLPAEHSRGTVESLLNVRIVCPLGGDYSCDDLGGRLVWGRLAKSKPSRNQ